RRSDNRYGREEVCGRQRNVCYRKIAAETVEVEIPEKLALDDWPARSRTKLVPKVEWLDRYRRVSAVGLQHSSRCERRISSADGTIAQIIVSVPVEAIRSALGHRVDDGAHSILVLGRVIRCAHLKLLDGQQAVRV